MKKNKINIISIFILSFIIIKAIYKSINTLKMNDNQPLTNILVAPILASIVFLLFTYLIKNPHLLVKKSLSDFENTNQKEQKENIIYWRDYYYYFRLIILLIIGVIYFFE